MRYLLLVLVLVGCTTPVYKPRLDMATFQADCRYASFQLRELELSLDDYTQAKINDYSYYQQLKNNIWAIRSTCLAYRS
jgi:hypothetical protein